MRYQGVGVLIHTVRNNILLNVGPQTVVCHGFEYLTFKNVTYDIL